MDTISKVSLLYCVLSCTLLFAGFCRSVDLQPAGDFVEVCVGSTAQFTCTTSTVHLGWLINHNDQCFQFFSASSDVGVETEDCDFVLVLVSNTASWLVSTATLSNVKPTHNATDLACWNTLLSLTASNAETANVTIIVPGPPCAPLSPEFLPQSLTSVVLSWTSPNDSLCITNYTVILTNITESNESYTYNTATNITSLTVSDLTQRANYSFTVAGVDTGGQVGEESVPSNVLTFDVPDKVIAVHSFVQFDTVSISWMPPPPSSRPPVTGYKISHNTTGSVLVNQTNETTFTIEGVAPGVYLFAIKAFNILGDGDIHTCSLLVPITEINSTTVGPVNMNSSIAVSGISVPRMNGVTTTVSSSLIMTRKDSSMYSSSATLHMKLNPTSMTSFSAPSVNNADRIEVVATAIGAIVAFLVTTIIVLLLVLLIGKIYCFRRKISRSGLSIADNVYDHQEKPLSTQFSPNDSGSYQLVNSPLSTIRNVRSEYSELSIRFGAESTRPAAPSEDAPVYSQISENHRRPKIESEYSEIRLVDTTTPSSAQSTTVQYAVLSERDVNAPPILPPDIEVTYTKLKADQSRPSDENVSKGPGYTISEDASEAPHSYHPPLPPRS